MRLISALCIIFVVFVMGGCTKEFGGDCVEGVGEIERRTVDLDPLTKIDLAMQGELFIQEGEQFIEIEAPSDIIDRILDESEISSERWIIEIDDCYDGPPIRIWATLPQFLALDVSGSGDIVGLDTLRNVNKLNLEIDGLGDIQVNILDAEKLDSEIKGSGDITVHGRNIETVSCEIQGSGNIFTGFDSSQSTRLQIQGSGNIELIGTVVNNFIEIEGSGNVFAVELCSDNCTIDSQGDGNCEVKVNDLLDINLSGNGNICYRGQPIISTDIEGTGKISICN